MKVIGTDAWGLDRPFMALRAEYERTGDASILWEAHRAGIDREYCQIEKLHNLGALPGATGFTVSCLPVKVAGASAGWCRAAAIVDERLTPSASPRCCRGYCLDVQPGQQVLVRSTTLAAPLLLALQREILEREAWPALRVVAARPDRGLLGGGARRPPRRPRARRARRHRGLGLPADASRRPRTRASSRASTRRGWRARRARGSR